MSSNDNEAAEATVVPEMVDEESQAGDADSTGSDPATGDVEPEPEPETEVDTGEEEAQSGAQDEEADSAGEESQEADSSDPEVGGGTPETAAEEAAAEEATSEEMTSEETTSEETTTEESSSEASAGDEEVVEGDETTDAEAGDTAEAEAGSSAEAETEAAAAAEDATQPDSATTIPATHTVAPGENLYRIGLKYGMSWVTLAAYNNLPNANYIRVGQVLYIPGGTAPPVDPPTSPPDEPGYTNYVVQRGDTLNSIGRKFGVSWVDIAEANGIVNPNLIYAGQVLKIPADQPETPPALTHTVKRGETLYRISLQYGVHWLAIAQANHIAPPYVIYPGQVLTIPSG